MSIFAGLKKILWVWFISTKKRVRLMLSHGFVNSFWVLHCMYCIPSWILWTQMLLQILI